MKKQKRILFIEDNQIISDLYKQKFKEEGLELVVAEKGKIGLEMLEKYHFDLLLLDIVLPDMDGWEILRRIKKNKRLADLKVVILSNLGQKTEVEKGLRLGCDKYLIKANYTPTEVVAQIKRMIKEDKSS